MFIKLEQIEQNKKLKELIEKGVSAEGSGGGNINFATSDEIKKLIAPPEFVPGILVLKPNENNLQYKDIQDDPTAIERGSREELPWDCVDCSNVTSLSNTLAYNSDLKYSPKLIHTENVTSMHGLFENNNRLKKVQPFDDISACEVFDWAFAYCNCLGYFDYFTFPKTSQPVSCKYMFECDYNSDFYGRSAIGLLSAPNIEFQIKNAYYMFAFCAQLYRVPEYDMSKCEDMTCMFYGCEELKGNDGAFPWTIDCSSLTMYPYGMFGKTKIKNVKLKNVPESVKKEITIQRLFALGEKDNENDYTIEFE